MNRSGEKSKQIRDYRESKEHTENCTGGVALKGRRAIEPLATLQSLGGYPYAPAKISI